MPHPRILDTTKAVLVVIDIQEGFRNALPDFALIASRSSIAVRGFQILKVPVIVTEQYPQGLGHTAEEIGMVLAGDPDVLNKITFSAYGAKLFAAKLEEFGIEQVVLCGVETHICVSQTAHDLLDHGFQVHLLTDCVGSRFEHDKRAALTKLQDDGVIPSSVEMALFELMRDAKHPEFREIQALIR